MVILIISLDGGRDGLRWVDKVPLGFVILELLQPGWCGHTPPEVESDMGSVEVAGEAIDRECTYQRTIIV